MKDEMPDVIYLNQSKTSYYTTAEMSVGADVSTSYTRTDIHESEVKRLQDAMELARGEVNKLEARIRQKKGFYTLICTMLCANSGKSSNMSESRTEYAKCCIKGSICVN